MNEQHQQQNRYPLLSESAGKDLYYAPHVNRWTHVHVNVLPNGVRNPIFYDGHLVQIAANQVQCETCERIFLLTPPPEKWDSSREQRVDEVRRIELVEIIRRLRETDHPKVWECISKTPGDGRIYRIVFHNLVKHFICSCRDYRDYADRFWKCKHVRAVVFRQAQQPSGRSLLSAPITKHATRSSICPTRNGSPSGVRSAGTVGEGRY